MSENMSAALSNPRPAATLTSMRPSSDSHRRNSNQQVAAKMLRAERRRCPKCERKDAIRKEQYPAQTVWFCRWCDYVRTVEF